MLFYKKLFFCKIKDMKTVNHKENKEHNQQSTHVNWQ